jgi:hypothetical protein
VTENNKSGSVVGLAEQVRRHDGFAVRCTPGQLPGGRAAEADQPGARLSGRKYRQHPGLHVRVVRREVTDPGCLQQSNAQFRSWHGTSEPFGYTTQ